MTLALIGSLWDNGSAEGCEGAGQAQGRWPLAAGRGRTSLRVRRYGRTGFSTLTQAPSSKGHQPAVQPARGLDQV